MAKKEKEKVYIWNDNGCCVTSTDLERARIVYGLTREPDMTVASDELLSEYAGLVRVIDGKIVLGWTDAEKAAQEKAEREGEIAELKRKLSDTDYISAKIAEGSATKDDYAGVIAERQEWRKRINELGG